jgi:hypothetical protein
MRLPFLGSSACNNERVARQGFRLVPVQQFVQQVAAVLLQSWVPLDRHELRYYCRLCAYRRTASTAETYVFNTTTVILGKVGGYFLLEFLGNRLVRRRHFVQLLNATPQ